MTSARDSSKNRAKSSAGRQPARGRIPRIFSIAGLQKDRGFAGRFQVASASYAFEYVPARAEVVSGKLSLLGDLSVVDPQMKKQIRKNVRLVLESTQGGLGGVPTPRVALPASTEAAAARRNQAGSSAAVDRTVPVTDSTGPLSFVGVMYLRFEPLVGSQLGLGADLSQLQLNARLYPANPTEETLQYLYSQITDALYGVKPDHTSANVFVKDLNQVLSSGS